MKKVIQALAAAGLLAGGAIAATDGCEPGKQVPTDIKESKTENKTTDSGTEPNVTSHKNATNAKAALVLSALLADDENVEPVTEKKSQYFDQETARKLRALFEEALNGDIHSAWKLRNQIVNKAQNLFPEEMMNNNSYDHSNDVAVQNRLDSIGIVAEDVGIPASRYINVLNGNKIRHALNGIQQDENNMAKNGRNFDDMRAIDDWKTEIMELLLNQAYEGNPYSSDFQSSLGMTPDEIKNLAADTYSYFMASSTPSESKLFNKAENAGKLADFLSAYGIAE